MALIRRDCVNIVPIFDLVTSWPIIYYKQFFVLMIGNARRKVDNPRPDSHFSSGEIVVKKSSIDTNKKRKTHHHVRDLRFLYSYSGYHIADLNYTYNRFILVFPLTPF